MTRGMAITGALIAVAGLAFSGVVSYQPAVARASEPSGQVNPMGYSPLGGITLRNVSQLGGAFLDHLEDGSTAMAQEASPVAVDGRLYVETAQGDVFAIKGATGQIVWEYKSGFPGTERGVAVGDGMVFTALGREHVVALNQATGQLVWRVQVGTPGQDTVANGSATPWTLYENGLVLTGTENGGFAGMRGHLYALNAANGSVAWTFAGTAGPGQPGHKSWGGDSWLLGGGDIWMPPTVDSKLGLLYVTAGNTQPRIDGGERPGRNFYANSVIALNDITGKLVWWFQSVHHDMWDFDDEMTPVVATISYPSGPQTVVIYGSKTGWLYYLNAVTGKPVIPVHNIKVPQLASQATWPYQTISAGDSLVPTCPQKTGPTRAVPDYISGCEFTPYGDQAVITTPGGDGGNNWAAMSLDPKTGLLYVPAVEEDFAFSDSQPYGQPNLWRPEGEFTAGLLDAVNPKDNLIVWQQHVPYGLSNGDGVLSTASGLLFEGSPDGVFSARNAVTGKTVWSWQTGVAIATTPITYKVRGVQYVAVLAGGSHAYPNLAYGDSLWVFKLGGTVPQASPPAPIPARWPILDGVTVAGSTVANTVLLGRVWNPVTGKPGGSEDLGSQAAMAPSIMTVSTGTTVTFENPAGNTHAHCAESFFDPASFKIGPLKPGQSGTFTFTKPGTYFYNDCAGFPWNTGEIIVTSST
jgi:PQQ-dependent dehydrogenase (methanol/ethanol family)